jgi:PAT family beta-lactamase induction signal transducer AmpG
MTEAAAIADAPPVSPRKPSIFNDRRRLAMLMLGFASGLPFTVVGGTLAAWFTAKGISTATIGILSWSALAYSFKFLWSPALHRTAAPWFARYGLRRSWFLPLQAIQVVLLFGFATLDPTTNLLAIAGIAVLVSFISATFDIVLDAWRIETARDKDDVDALSTLVQAGYRSAAFVGGAGALILSDHMSWNIVLAVLALIMALTVAGSILAPEPKHAGISAKAAGVEVERRFDRKGRNIVVGLVALGWLWAFWTLGSFMIASLLHPETSKAGPFTLTMGPLIVAATVLAPALGAVWLIWFRKPSAPGAAPARELPHWLQSMSDGLFGSVIERMIDLIERLRWAALLALAIILSYRFADNIWGSFAYPFYMGAENGALGHTATEVAFASKMIGVVAIITGIAGGGLLLKWMGRMPALVIAAALAAATNLLFADLATHGAGMDAFLAFTHLDGLFGAFGENQHRMARLTIAILGENLAVGFASVVYLAYLTSMINPKYAAVQAALLGSLTMLIGQLGRPWLGALIESDGFAYVFMLTAAIGLLPVALSALEWRRQTRLTKAEVNGEAPPAPAL